MVHSRCHVWLEALVMFGLVMASHVQESSLGSCTDSGEDFAPSQLGTKEYWDNAYSRELQAYRDLGDVGEIWFGEESMNRVIRWMKKQNVPENTAILDIGTGNGVFLIELAKHGFMNLTGIDYSGASIELATNVLAEEGLMNIKVQEQDFLNASAELKGFDLCIDKGTFDAISLNPEGRELAKLQYVSSLRAALKPDGYFIVTSCNWTKEQLLQIFNPGFELLEELPTPRFQFGGVIGNSVTALVLRRLKILKDIET